MKTLFTVEAISRGGRSGTVYNPEGLLDVTLGNPLEAGIEKRGPSPEMLFAGACSACFHGAILNAGITLGLRFGESTVRALVSLIEDAHGGCTLSVEMHAQIPGLNMRQVRRIMNEAESTCPYAKAMRGDASVILIVDKPDVVKSALIPRVLSRVSTGSMARSGQFTPDISLSEVISILQRHSV